MIRNFRQVFKGNQMPMTVVMLVVLLGMVAYLAPSTGHPEAPDNVAARVYGHDILNRDVQTLVGNMARRVGKGADLERMLPFLQSQALSQLVQSKLMEELAERHGVVVTEQELAQALTGMLKRQPEFVQADGSLKPAAELNQILRQMDNPTSLKELEVDLHRQLLIQKLLTQSAAQVPVDEAWLNLEQRARTEKLDLETLSLKPDPTPVADPGDGALQGFLAASGHRFQQPPRRVVQYVAVGQDRFRATLQVDDAAVRRAYESKKAQYTELSASHILFRAQTEAQFAEAEKKAAELRAKLVAGGDFAKAAEEQSEDPTAKANKGDLGWFKSGSMVKAFEDAASALKPGEISQPVRTNFGVHLIKMAGKRTKSFEEAKDELKAQLTQERYATLARAELDQLRKRSGERGDLAPAARALNLKAELSQPFLETATEPIPQLSGGDLALETFRLKVGQVSKVLRAGDRFLVLRVQEERPVAVPPLPEIRGQVLAAWKLEEARKALAAKVQAQVASGQVAALGTFAFQQGTTVAGLGELGKHPAIRKALLATPAGQLTPALWTPDGQLWIARVKTRSAAEPLDFAKRQALVAELQRQVSEGLLNAELQHMDTRGRARAGFSSLWGRFGGIWVNPALSKLSQGMELE